MNVGETVLYIKDNKGAMREWAISAVEDMIVIRYGQVYGSMQYQTEHVSRGKATRSLDEQIMSRMASRISSQRDKGYVLSYDEAWNREHTVNAMGLLKPMLAHKIENVRNIDYTDAIVQPKFDGNRCLIYCEDGVNKAYSRNGKPVEAITHILEDLVLEEGQILDGELYCHGYPLQTIVSWIKRKQENTKLLKYHLYDIVAPSLPFKERSSIIRGIPIGESISPVYGDPTSCYEEVLEAFRAFRADGYEGAILRWGDTGYEDGKRSKSLVKIKEWHDDEFLVTDIHESRDGWAILECETQSGNTFRVSAPGTIEEKERILRTPDFYKCMLVTVEYANLTKDGIPFHPVAIRFREDV